MLKQILTMSCIAFLLASCGAKSTANKLDEKEKEMVKSDKMHLLVGTYTSGEDAGEGIYVYCFDTETGESDFTSKVAISNPSYLTITKDAKFVYSVSENSDGTDAANAFSFDAKTGNLVLLNTELTKGNDPCYISVDESGKNVVTANYSGGSISVFKTLDDGKLSPIENEIKFSGKGVNKERQNQPHLHCVAFTPDHKYLFANDLGTDRVYKFNVDAASARGLLKLGTPAEFKIAEGSGPRHIVFHPEYKYAYLITEISGDVVAFHYDNGNLEQFQTIKADSLNAQGSGDIQISPDGKFLYASNRLKGDGVAIFSINQLTGELTHVGYQDTGIHPRNFVITPNSKYLLVACRDTNAIQVFERNIDTGMLTNVNKDIKVGKPVCLKFASISK